MSNFVRIEIKMESDIDIRHAALGISELGRALDEIQRDHEGEPALLLARERIKTTSQRMRKGLRDEKA